MPSVRNKELVVHLSKNKGENIGICVQQSKTAPANYEIKKLNENGAAVWDSSLRKGDLITAVNSKSIKAMNKDAVMLLLKQCAEMTHKLSLNLSDGAFCHMTASGKREVATRIQVNYEINFLISVLKWIYGRKLKICMGYLFCSKQVLMEEE